MYIIMFVLDDPAKLDKILSAWEEAGIRGVTIIESTGIQRRRTQQKHIAARFRFASFTPVTVGGEEGNYTLLTIVDNEEMIQNCLHATEKIVGDLNGPNTGIFTSWPLTTVKGLPKQVNQQEDEQDGLA